MKIKFLWMLVLAIAFAGCQGTHSSGGGKSSGPVATGAIQFSCVELGTSVGCGASTSNAMPGMTVDSLAPFDGATVEDAGDVSASGDMFFSFTATRDEATTDNEFIEMVVELPALCAGATLPATGWQWLALNTYAFDGDSVPHALTTTQSIVINCPALTVPGTYDLWALMAPGDQSSDAYNAWFAASSGHPAPDDGSVFPFVQTSAVITFNAVP